MKRRLLKKDYELLLKTLRAFPASYRAEIAKLVWHCESLSDDLDKATREISELRQEKFFQEANRLQSTPPPLQDKPKSWTEQPTFPLKDRLKEEAKKHGWGSDKIKRMLRWNAMTLAQAQDLVGISEEEESL